MRTLLVVIVALALGLIAAATAPSAEPASAPAAKAAAGQEPIVVRRTFRARQGDARSHVSIKETVVPPDPTWTGAVGEEGRVDLTHTGACPVQARITPDLVIRPEPEPVAVRGRMVTTRFDTARARSVIVRFFDGSVQADQIVGRRAGTSRIAGRLAAFGGSLFTAGGGETNLRNSIELHVNGRFGEGCDDAGQAQVLADLDLMLGGNPADQFPVTALYFRNLNP
jgi:hypothetical protein